MNPFPEPPVNAPKVSVGGLAAGQTAGAGRFLLERMLGQGGMGVVWLAQDRLLRERVALKFLPPQIAFDPAALQSLRREALQARKLSHPNIIRIHDLIDSPDEPPFICMEYVDGPTLHALRAEQPKQVLSWEFLSPLVCQLCSALDYAHGEKTIHRDIKPANLMLAANGRLKLADFGLARVVSDSMSRLSEQLHTSGTLGYMSPQQADGERPHLTDDLYSVGATLYELLAGIPPFPSGDIGYQVRHREPDPPSQRLAELELHNEIPAHVEVAILACLAKAPERRPQSAAELLKRIDFPGLVTPVSTSGSRTATRQAAARGRLGRFAATALATVICGTLAWCLVALLRPVGNVATLPAVEISNNEQLSPGSPVDDGFEVLFNGRDLTGWDGDTNYWHVRDGAITAFTSEEGITRRANTCLIWRDPVDDFELRLKFRLQDVITAKPANSGVLYRGRRLEGWRVQGYQCDLHEPHVGTLLLLWDTLSDPRTALGRTATLRDINGKTVANPASSPGSDKGVVSLLGRGDWNDLRIIARGNRLIHEVNGVRTAEVQDESSTAQSFSGCLALELKRATTVHFKDIRLKRTPPAVSVQR